MVQQGWGCNHKLWCLAGVAGAWCRSFDFAVPQLASVSTPTRSVTALADLSTNSFAVHRNFTLATGLSWLQAAPWLRSASAMGWCLEALALCSVCPAHLSCTLPASAVTCQQLVSCSPDVVMISGVKNLSYFGL